LWFTACTNTVTYLTKAQSACPFAKIFFINVMEEPEKAAELKYVLQAIANAVKEQSF
jgi:hypothetical protein